MAQGLKTIEDATEVRRKILIAFEAAEREADPERRREWMTFVLVGGGPTGVELAGALGEIARDTLKRDFRADPSRRTRRSSSSRPWTGCCRRIRRTLGVGAAPARAARRRRPHEDAGHRDRRAARPGDHPRRLGGDDPDADGAVGGRGAGLVVRAQGRRGDRGADRSGRPGARRARPDGPGAPGDLRGRRCGGAAVARGSSRRRASRRAASRAGPTPRRSSGGGSWVARTSRTATRTTATSR